MQNRRDLGAALRGGPLLAVVGGLAALVAVWAAAVPRPPQTFGTADPDREVKVLGYNDPDLAGPRSEIDAARYVGPRGPESWLGSLVGWAAVAAVAAGLLFLLLLAVRAVLRAYRDRRTVTPDDAVDDLERVAVAVTRDAEGRIVALSGGTPAEGIVAAWEHLEHTLRGAGVPLPASRTSTETTVATLGRFSVDESTLSTLAGLYREATWSRHDLTEADRERAEAALRDLDAALRSRTAGTGAARA